MTRLLSLAVSAVLMGCGDKDEACTDGSFQCTDDALEECVDGAWETSQDCAAEDMICHDMGDDSHCMEEGSMEM